MRGIRLWCRGWLIVLVVFALIDAGWIMAVARPLYQSALGTIMAPTFDPLAAILFYVLYCAGLTYFGLAPLRHGLSAQARTVRGALYGFLTYATWALTLKVVIVGVPWFIVISDIGWGTFLGASVTGIAAWLTRKIDLKTQSEETQ